MQTEPAYSRYEALLKRLHDLNLEGKLDSPEADLVREDMEEPWSRLSAADKALLAGLSSDLYSFSGEEVVRASDLDQSVLMTRVRAAYESRDWPGLLEALRFTHHHFPAEVVAYMRGRCWQEFGRPEAALWFFERAHKLAPANRNYTLLRLDALFRAGRHEEAFAEAEEILSKRDAPAALVFGAAKVFYDSAVHLPPTESRQLHESIVVAVSAALSSIDQNAAIEATTPQSLILSGRLHQALALEQLGKLEEAAQAYDDAIARHPSSDELLMARALFLLRTERQAAAQRDLDELIGRRTHLASAYLFRAHQLLEQQDYARSLELSDRGLRRATHAATRAVFLEWIAISRYGLNAPVEDVRSQLEDAMNLDPRNEDVIRNLLALAEVPARAHLSLSTRGMPDPYEALRDLRERLQPTA
jgi:tetratricopeptide (TPR) repeat protein